MINLIKIGGAIIQNRGKLKELLQSFNYNKLLIVHGYSQTLKSNLNILRIKKTRFISNSGMESYFTDHSIASLCYFSSYQDSRIIVESLNGSIKVLHLMGFEGVLFGKKKIIRYIENNIIRKRSDDLSAEIIKIKIKKIYELFEKHDVIVLTPIISEKEGGILTSDADYVTYKLASSLQLSKYDIITEVGGFIKDNKIITEMNLEEAKDNLGFAAGGMRKKLYYVIKSLESGIDSVFIKGFSNDVFTKIYK